MSEQPATQPSSGGGRGRKRGLWVLIILAVLIGVALAVFFRPTTTVPDLTGKPQAQAQSLLDAATLRMGTQSEVATTSDELGIVVAQTPAAGSSVKRRTAVDLTVTARNAVAAIPDVSGMPVSEAQAALENLVFEVVAIDVLDSPEEYEVGTVISQVPAPGTDWQSGQPVAIAVAAGPDDGTGTEVPDVIASSFDAAVVELANAGLLALGITENPDDLERSDVDVVEQLPKPGVMVRQGSTVAVRMGQ